MKSIEGIGLDQVREVYSGAEGKLWELIMGQQIHIGGLKSSMDLADKAGIAPGVCGVDFCCCTGAGMRFLIQFRNVDSMIGVDATPHTVETGMHRNEALGIGNQIQFVIADVCDSGLPSESADFVWGEDAWCYVVDKARLVSEAARIVKRGGTIAFTDWVEGPNPMTAQESERFLKFMKFANVLDVAGYSELLKANNCKVIHAEDTGRYSPCIDLYLQMLDMQLTYDALKVIGFNTDVMQSLAGEMSFLQGLARESKVIQGLFVAQKD
ncbi:MAG TPA: methyltransferase domain-containing protein [Armatimonadota bacterium]